MKPDPSQPTHVVARNRKALHDYEILERFEAGIELLGSEVKSIRSGHITIIESYAQCIDGQAFLQNLNIGVHGHQTSMFVHEPFRKRRLLLQKRQIRYLAQEVAQRKLALVPLQIYFKKQWVKVELGLARGRKQYDKRQKIAEQESRRSIARLMAESRRQ